jgi:hypothetical protein
MCAQIFNKDSIPGAGWQEFQRKNNALAMRIDGQFEVETINGVVVCDDGYLAIDACGWPYPLEKEVFERTYKKA